MFSIRSIPYRVIAEPRMDFNGGESQHGFLGKGRPHGGPEILPPTLGAVRSITHAFTSWITAEGLVGNLDSLRLANEKQSQASRQQS